MAKEMRKNTNRAPKRLLILVVGWVLLWIFHNLIVGDWFPRFFDHFLFGLTLMLVIFVGIILIIPSIVAVILSLFRWLTRRERFHVVSFLTLIIMLAVYFLPIEIPSRPAMTFCLHRGELIELADLSISKVQNIGRGFRLPESPLYESAVVDRDVTSKALVIEFIIGNSYLPLVYISTDNPDDVEDTCSRGGVPIDRLEPKWYVCLRDWN